MEFIGRYFLILYEGMSQEINVYGFKFSFWGIMIFVALVSIVIAAIRSIFS